MIYGRFRDRFPRIPLTLALQSGRYQTLDFVLDTGFEGDLIIPPDLLPSLEAVHLGEHPFALADQTRRECPVYELRLDWDGEERRVEAVIMEGRPLVGIGVLLDNLIEIEMTEGGGISVASLG